MPMSIRDRETGGFGLVKVVSYTHMDKCDNGGNKMFHLYCISGLNFYFRFDFFFTFRIHVIIFRRRSF